MLYIIGLGLNIKGITQEGMEAVKKCKVVYLENYTVDLPYSSQELVEKLKVRKLFPADRNFVESLEIVDEAKKKDVALLVYGSPLTATTHITILQECTALKIKCRVIYSASVFDGVAETGLQLYKFGKIASMPKWDLEKNYAPDSFMEIVKDNQKIEAHSLILVDIGMRFDLAMNQLKKAAENHEVKLNKLVVCQQLGTKNSKIMYRDISELEDWKGVKKPYCIIIPGKLHFVEKDVLKGFE